MEDDEAGDEIPTPSPPLVTQGELALSDSEKVEALADNLEAQFQPVNDPSDQAFIETVSEALEAYSYAPASEPKLTNLAEVQDAIRVSRSARLRAQTLSRLGL